MKAFRWPPSTALLFINRDLVCGRAGDQGRRRPLGPWLATRQRAPSSRPAREAAVYPPAARFIHDARGSALELTGPTNDIGRKAKANHDTISRERPLRSPAWSSPARPVYSPRGAGRRAHAPRSCGHPGLRRGVVPLGDRLRRPAVPELRHVALRPAAALSARRPFL